MDIVIVDDEALARHRLARMLEGSSDHRVVAEAVNSQEALEAVMREDPDIVLLDIHMPGETGLQAAQAIGALDDAPAIIFCTAYDQHALDAFSVNATGYLLKPVRQQQLLQAIEQCSALNKAQKTSLQAPDQYSGRAHISAKIRGSVELIALEDIYYFVADHKYVTVYHSGGETLIDDTLKELEQAFSTALVRVHRNALVAIKGIQALEKASDGHFSLRLHNCDHRPVVSRRHVSSIRELLSML